MVNPETLSTGKTFLLLEFIYGDSSEWKLTNANTDLNTAKGLYLSDSKIKVKLPTNSIANFGKAEATVEISLGEWLFAQDITSGRAFPPLTLTIYKRFSDYIRKVFVGRVTKAVRNPNGREGIVKLHVSGAKNDLDQAGGFSCNNTCGWDFGNSKTCQYNIDDVKESGVGITLDFQSNDSNKVTINGLATHPNRYWRRGSVEKDGLNIRIREWLNGTDFYLSKLPPLSWDGAEVTVTPGCDKRFTTCSFWNNLEHFSGIGLYALEYNPIIENWAQ